MEKSRVLLVDKSSTGKVRRWRDYKEQNMYITEAYKEVDMSKAERLSNCATWLKYARNPDSDVMTLKQANFCRVRLCPVCQWRRSLKVYGQMRQILDALKNSYKYIFLTLTIRNCEGYQLSDYLDALNYAFNLLTKSEAWGGACRGYFKAVEVTRNRSTGTYHPHMHVLVAVNPSYFKSRYYLSYDRWRDLWEHMLNVSLSKYDLGILDYKPQINVQRVKDKDGDMAQACCEVSKYSVKSADIICYDDWDLTVETVRTLDMALNGRRLATMGGVIRKEHRRLHLQDADGENADLLNVGENVDDIQVSDDADTLLYIWHSGYSEYVGEFDSPIFGTAN